MLEYEESREQRQGVNERVKQVEKGKERKREPARTRLARVRGCRYGAKEEAEKVEKKERDVLSLEGERGKGARTKVYVCVCVGVRWEVSSERRGEGKRKGADIPEGRLVGKELMHAKEGAGRKRWGGGEREGNEGGKRVRGVYMVVV